MRMADLPYSGVTSFMIKTLLDKKYALPYRVVDALVDHFTAFRSEGRVLPVIWHLCLLTFVQRYKHDVRASVRPPPLPPPLAACCPRPCHHAPGVMHLHCHGGSCGALARQ